MDTEQPLPIAYATPVRNTKPAVVAPPPVIGWRTAVAVTWLLALMAGGVGTVSTLSDHQLASGALFDASSKLGGWIYASSRLGAFAVAVGGAAAAVLYFWPATRLAWVATLALVAGGWSSVLIGNSDEADPKTLTRLWVAAIIQAGLIYAGTHLGRPLARWLTRQLVPPPLRPSLLALWG